MPTNKSRRGRPKRSNDLLEKDKKQKHALVTSQINFSNLNIKQPLIIVRRDDEDLASSKPTTPQQISKVGLPKVVFATIESEKATKQSDLGSITPFDRSESCYIRYEEPTEEELFEKVEYDMDEMDKAWLEIYNQGKGKDHKGEVTPFLFESIMDRLEKEWFRLIQDMSVPSGSEDVILPEDSPCAVCCDTEVENSNAIVFCDGCDVAVHQDCYGVPYIPEGQWLCKRCQLSPDEEVSCIFCPNEGGAFKQTTDKKWGHLMCAFWIPEVRLKNTVYMEPIDYIDKVPKGRWKLVCYICKKRQGACIQCDNKNCFSAFHVSCAVTAGLSMKMTLQDAPQGGIIMKAYCGKHTPKEVPEETPEDTSLVCSELHTDKLLEHNNIIKKSAEEAHHQTSDHKETDLDHLGSDSTLSKMSKTNSQHHATGAPVVPNVVLSNIDDMLCLQQASIKNKALLVTSIAHYWSLKREHRRGAPLLKRLQLEPWAVTNTIAQVNKGDNRLISAKKEFIIDIRASLDKARMLSEQVQRRERLKLEKLKRQKEYVETILYPVGCVFHSILNELIEIDTNEFFKYPVTDEDAPDYANIIAHPMSFSKIQEKLELHRYSSLQEFKHDINLIWDNCMEYNTTGSKFYRMANKLKKHSATLFTSAEKLGLQRIEQEFIDTPLDLSIFDYDMQNIDGGATNEEIPDPNRASKAFDGASPQKLKTADTLKTTPENYTIIESGARQATLENWIAQSSDKPANLRMSERVPKPIPEDAHIKTRQEKPSVLSVDAGVQTDSYLLLSLFRDFATQQAIKILVDDKQKNEEKSDTLHLETVANHQSVELNNTESLDETLPNPSEYIDTSMPPDAPDDDTEEEVIINVESPDDTLYAQPLAEDIPSESVSTDPQSPTSSERSVSIEPQAVESSESCCSTESQTHVELEGPQDSSPQNHDVPYEENTRSSSLAESNEILSAKRQNQSRTLLASNKKETDLRKSEVQLEPVSSSGANTSEEIEVASTVEQKNTADTKKQQPVTSKKPLSTVSVRATRSRGLSANMEEIKKRKRMSTEARVLMDTLLHFENKSKPEEKYRTSNHRQAPVGWAYIESEDEDGSGTDRTDEAELDLQRKNLHKRKKIEQASLDNFSHKEIVWARVSGYPSHPAKLIKELDASSSLIKSKRSSSAVLVEFLKVPDNHKWGWILPNNITKFGNTDTDQMKLAECLKAKGSMRTSRIQEAREGYQYACSLIEKADSKSILDSIFNEANMTTKKKPSKSSKSTKKK